MMQGTDEWLNARLGKVTASRIVDVMAKPTTATYQNYQAQLVCERLTGQPTEFHVTPAMQHGTDTEPQARANYEFATAFDVQEVGFIPHPNLAMAGASPDGLIGTDGGLEIKCPQPPKHMKTLMGAKIDRGYVFQMQWNMACTDREWWDFVSYSNEFPEALRCHIQRVPRDAEVVEEITAKVTQFLAECDALYASLIEKQEAA